MLLLLGLLWLSDDSLRGALLLMMGGLCLVFGVASYARPRAASKPDVASEAQIRRRRERFRH